GEIEEFIAIRYDVTKEVELKMALEKKEHELELLNKTLEERVKLQTRKLYELNKHLEERIREEVRKNEEKQKMLFMQSRLASLGQIMANIAHQWRQPLTELALSLFNLKKAAQKHDTHQIDTAYNDAKALIQNMSQTIEDFINFFKPDKPKTRFALAESLDEALQILEKTLEKEYIEVHRDIDETLQVEGVTNELSQVLINLLQNAKDAFKQRNVRERRIDIRIYRDGNEAVVEIGDNAGGIEPEVIERIFEPYFTTKHAAQGTGLGLFMSKMIVEKSFDGSVNVENRDGGARFSIRLPLES
ncbi:MAG: PAS domain-containing sensor histidine kinase, partial [Campylobacteraceae bacterium 4484_4]